MAHISICSTSTSRALEAVGHDLEAAEVGLVYIDRGHDLLAVDVLDRRGTAGEARERLLVEAADHDHVGLAAGVPDRLQHGLEVRLGKRALRAVDPRAGAVGGRRIGTTRAFRRIALDPG